MIDQKTLDFLRELSRNNNRDWFQANKARYEAQLKNPFEHFIGQLILELQTLDPGITIEPKQAIFRIYRDTRFSKDKTPYKTHVSALISKFGRKVKEYPGFYLHLEAGVLMLGGGAYFLEKASLEKLRRHIALNPQRFSSLLQTPGFVGKYGALKGEQHKRLPAEFAKVTETIPLIANKQYYYMAELDPNTVLQNDLLAKAVDYFRVGKPLNDFLAEGIYGTTKL